MSKRETSCLSFIFGACYRKKTGQRNAISVEHSGINDRIKEIATQTQDNPFRSSAPTGFYHAPHRPIIAVRSREGFQIQNDRLVIKNDDVQNNFLSSVISSDIESIHNEPNEDPLLSSKSIKRLFSPASPSNTSKVIPNLFKCDSNTVRPKLLPITPEQFFKRKVLPASRPVKPLEKMMHDSIYKNSELKSREDSMN
jgi:hypothetical protein